MNYSQSVGISLFAGKRLVYTLLLHFCRRQRLYIIITGLWSPGSFRGRRWHPSLWSQGPSGGGGTPVRTSTWDTPSPPPPPQPGSGHGPPPPLAPDQDWGTPLTFSPPPRTQDAMDRIRHGRYVSCGRAGRLSCLRLCLHHRGHCLALVMMEAKTLRFTIFASDNNYSLKLRCLILKGVFSLLF